MVPDPPKKSSTTAWGLSFAKNRIVSTVKLVEGRNLLVSALPQDRVLSGTVATIEAHRETLVPLLVAGAMLAIARP